MQTFIILRTHHCNTTSHIFLQAHTILLLNNLVTQHLTHVYNCLLYTKLSLGHLCITEVQLAFYPKFKTSPARQLKIFICLNSSLSKLHVMLTN